MSAAFYSCGLESEVEVNLCSDGYSKDSSPGKTVFPKCPVDGRTSSIDYDCI